MEGCLLDIAKNEVQSLVNLMKNEAQYLCCFNSYVENFDKKKEILAAKHHDVKREFQKGKGVFSFKYEARQWECEAEGIINVDTKMKEKCFFFFFSNCWWQYRRGRELAEKTQRVEELLGRCNSNIVAGRANISDIIYLSSQDFIHFKSRELEFEDLMKVLQDGNYNMIGLQGMGGVGKTLMAKEAGRKLEESKLIDKLIFLVISKPPDFKKIRGELAKGLGFDLETVNEEELLNIIWSKITHMDESMLIILDDVWEKFDLTENLGIPSGHQHKKGCNLLITTRSSHVCKEMGCQTIELQTLTDEEALDLFLSHASISSSSHGLKGMPQKIVKHCRGVPVAILAIARALKNQDTSVWKDALKILEDRSVDQNLEEAYKCLKLSYDHLKNKKAKELLLISSIFPEDYEISIPLLTEIGIGLGSFGENDKYSLQRSNVREAIMELIYSFLLLNVEEECVKMHDLIREVALWIGDKDIKSLMNLKSPIKENLRYLFWQNDDFPDEFEGNNLEVLLLFLDGSKNLNVSNTFFKEIMKLKVLVLVSNYKKRISALTLTNSLQPLKYVQTLTLDNLELGDISILGNLLSLVTLHFYDCSIIELPAEFLKLNKLGSLQVERCVIEKNNPFEVIERCSQLEELNFVYNECGDEEKDAIYQNGSPLTLHRYYISFSKVRLSYFEECGPISRYFQIDRFCHLISDATLKQLVKGAEFLILEGEEALRIRKNHIHDIVAIDEGGMMNDLIVLHLRSCPNVECLIDTKDHDSVVTAFSNLTELHLFEMGIEDLCMGPPPPGFLEQLEIMELTECHKLKRTLPNGNFNLCHLKSMELKDCPKLTSVFQPSTARSLMQLEVLTIRSCSALECIIAGEDGDSNQKNYFESLFPKLRMFHIEECNKLRAILPILFAGGLASLETIIICDSQQLEYIFDELQKGEDAMFRSLKKLILFRVPSFIGIFRTYHQLMSSSVEKPSPPLSRHNSNNINQSPAGRAFSWVQTCCSLNKTRPPSEETNIVSEQRSLDDTNAPKEQHSSNQNQNDELHFHLPALEAIYIANAPKINSICAKNYKMVLPSLQNVQICHCSIKSFSDYNMVNWTTIEELDASTDGVSPFHTAQSFLLESFKNVRKIKLVNCWNIISLSTLSIEASTNSFENLTIKHCNNLKCITTHEGDAQVGKNYCSIFPRLETLEIEDCGKLEFLFLSTISSGLEKLKSLTIKHVPELKYVVGKYEKEQHSSNQNQNDELHFDLPILEILYMENAPNINSICTKNFIMVLPSLQNVQMWHCGIKSLIEYNMVNWTTTKESDAYIDGVPSFHAAQSFSVQSLKNVREIKLVNCWNIISLSTLSNEASTNLFENLTISHEHNLKCNTTHEGDAQVGLNYCSNFPRLEILEIDYCIKLEFLFLSAISCGLEKLKSLTIKRVPELKYVVGKYQKEQHSSNQNENDELHFNLPALETLYIENAPNINSICAKNYKMVLPSLQNIQMWHCGIKSVIDYDTVNWTTPEELDASIDGVPPFRTAKSFLVQSLNNVREIKLVNCWNIISLLTLFIEASTISFENLTFSHDHEGDAQVGQNYCSIFPRLEILEIEYCMKLEFLFLSAICGGLEKLKSLTIKHVPELKYVVGKYKKKQHSSNENQNDELHFDLPALETLHIENAPKINSICAKNYKMVLLSLQNVQMRHCGIKSFSDYNMVNWTTIEELHASTDGAHLFHVAQSLLTQSLRNIRKIELVKCANLILVSPLSIASTILLEELTIYGCDNLKYIVVDEEDARTRMNYNSIFPKLKQLQVSNCDALEYLFPAYTFRCHAYLESLRIDMTPKLKYVFGKSQHKDSLTHENQNIQTHINFPALKDLSIRGVPELVNIYPENYYLRESSLKSIALVGFPELTMRPFNEFLVCWHTKLQVTKGIEMCGETLKSLVVGDSKVEVIFDLTYMDIEKNGDGLEPLASSIQELELQDLSQMVNICVGPKCIICFHSLQRLFISACKKLKVIFSKSTVRSLPMLKHLDISKCEELVRIVEEDYETNADDHLCHEPCFPNLEQVYIFDCDKLKYLFSITISDILPKLNYLRIDKAYEFKHVLIRQGEMKEMVVNDVLPQLRILELTGLPNLVSICHGINFQILKAYQTEVLDCPNFSFYETSTTQLQEIADSHVEDKAEEKLSSHLSIEQSLHMGEATQQSLMKVIQEDTGEIVEDDFLIEITKTTTSSSESKLTGQLDELASKNVKNEAVMMDPTAIGIENPTKKVPIRTSPNLNVLPARDNTHASAKIFEEQEQEQVGLMTSRCPRSGMKASISLSEDKLETSIDDDPSVPLVTIILSEQTSEAILSSKASTSLNPTPSSILPKSSDETTTTQLSGGSKNEDSEVWEGTEQKLSSHSNGRQALETPQSKIGSSNFTTDELVGKEVQKETIIMEPQSQQETTGHDIQSHKEEGEEEEREGGLITMRHHQSDIKAKRSLLKEKPETSIHDDVQVPNESQALTIVSSGSDNLVSILHPITSLEGVHNEGIKEASMVQNESKTNVTCHGDQANPHNLTHIEQESSHSKGQIVESHDWTKSDIVEDTKLSLSQFSTPVEMMSSFLETNNEASIVPGVQEIVDMMKLEGFERSIFANALETRPQLQLSTKDRSPRMLCMSYKVLLDILNILTTRTPLTITEANKRLLAEHLKDAYLLGFDKDWIESVKTKVFDCKICEVDSIQKVLKGLDYDLKINETMLEAIRDEEVKAARVVEVAQQEHANVMARHAHLLKARQDIIAQRHQCWEIIAAKNRHFGF